MKIGCIPGIVMKRSVLKQLHTVRKEVLVKVSPEESCSTILIKGSDVPITQGTTASFCASASITGNSVYAGMYASARAINDLAMRGGFPTALSVQVMLPVSKTEKFLKTMTANIEALCKKANVQLAVLHGEVTSAVREPVIFAAVQGEGTAETMCTAGKAQPGQDIVLCGCIGTEGMLRILDERETELSKRFVPAFVSQMQRARESILSLEYIRAARELQSAQGEEAAVTAMHQIGSGGILAALWELGEASGIGMQVELSKMSVLQETIELCEYYGLNPYHMTSAGCILMTASDGDTLVEILEGVGARASKLGIATDQKARVIASGGEKRYLDRPAPDEWARWKEETLTIEM